MSENTENKENKEEKVLGIEDIIKAKVEKDRELSAPIEIYIKGLGGKVKFTRATTKQIKRVGYKAISKNVQDIDDAQRQLIYNCCPVVKNNYKKLRETYDVNSNLDIIDAIFTADEQNEILLKLQGKTDEEIQEAYRQVKNL